MSFFDKLFGKKESSASKAKDRLRLVLETERGANAIPNMDEMREELIKVIQKYTKVKDIKIISEKNHDIDVLALEIILDN
jgi:cell division topological specificity factor